MTTPSDDLRQVNAIRWTRIGLVGMTAVAFAAFFAFRISDPFWALLCGAPLAGLIRFEYLLHVDRREQRHAAALDQREARRDGYPAGPPVEVWSMNADEWEAAKQRALDELGVTYEELAGMARTHDYPTFEHRKLWLVLKPTPLSAWAEHSGREER